MFDEPSHVFLDTGARVNLISLDFLRKIKPGVIILEPATYNVQGVTGNKMSPIGETLIAVTFGNYYKFDLKAVVVEHKTFPGNLLIGYDTMRDEDITIIPARGGVKLSYKFLPFIAKANEVTAPVSQPLMINDSTVSPLNSVAERQENNTVKQVTEVPQEMVVKPKESNYCKLKKTKVDKQITTSPQDRDNNNQEQDSKTDFTGKVKADCSDVALEIASGHVIECTLLQSMTISKVKLELKGVKEDIEVITLPETARVK